MKRFHVHAHVENLPVSIAFYSKMFAAEPTRVRADEAKWMLPVFSEATPEGQEQAPACCAGSAPKGRPVGVPVKGAPTASCC